MAGREGHRRSTRAVALRRLRVAGLALAVAAAVLAVGALVAIGHPARQPASALPKGFPKPVVPKSNPTTSAKAEIGRRLFYDKRLSGNGTQSCGSCHLQSRAFTDGRAQAVGSTGEMHPRGAQSLVNVAYAQTLTWANPALRTLERQMEVPLFNRHPIEMGLNDKNKGRVLRRLRRDRWYAARFRRVFPRSRTPMTYSTIVKSIAAFQRTIISANSRYDRYVRGQAKLTASERRGARAFMGERAECHHCHGSFIFNDQVAYVGAPRERARFHNNGLYNLGGTGAYPEPNVGIFEFTGRRRDMGRFKAPSLRNVALTAPYMHDGSIKTLREVVDHYAGGGRVITDGPNAGDGRRNPNKDPNISGISLTARERADLVAFLRTLTDRSVTRDPRFADPFAKRRGRP